MTRALVLGATGHIGAHVVRALLAEGHTVRAAYHREQFLPVLDGLSVERVPVDLESLEGLSEALKGCPWVFHAAGYYPGSRERRAEAIERAIRTTRRILEVFQRAAPERVVFTSSASTIRRVPDRLATEQDAEPWPLPAPPLLRFAKQSVRGQAGLADPRPLYAVVKVAMEHEALRAVEAGLPAVIVNPSVCIGEYDAHRFSGRAVLLFAKNRMPFYLDVTLNAIYTGDVGVGHVRAAHRGRIGGRYLLAGPNIPLKEFADLVARTAGVSPPRWRAPHRLALAVASASELVAWLTRTEPFLSRSAIHTARQGPGLDASQARAELGLPQTPLEEAIARAVGWFKAHGFLS